jgi:hypothetical protein
MDSLLSKTRDFLEREVLRGAGASAMRSLDDVADWANAVLALLEDEIRSIS